MVGDIVLALIVFYFVLPLVGALLLWIGTKALLLYLDLFHPRVDR